MVFKADNYEEITIDDGVISDDAIFEKLSIVEGHFNGYWNIMRDCWCYDMYNFCGWMRV